jgi:hypothetical protein
MRDKAKREPAWFRKWVAWLRSSWQRRSQASPQKKLQLVSARSTRQWASSSSRYTPGSRTEIPVALRRAAWMAWLISSRRVRASCWACEPIHWVKPEPSCQPVFHAPGRTVTSPWEP